MSEIVGRACRAFYDAAGVHYDTLAQADKAMAHRCMSAALAAVAAPAAPGEPPPPLAVMGNDFECCASGRCEACSPGFDWGRDG